MLNVKGWLVQNGLVLQIKMVDWRPLHDAITLLSNRMYVLIHFSFFSDKSESPFHSDFSHDGKETKDLAPSMLPPHKMLAHPRRWGGLSRRSNCCGYSFAMVQRDKLVNDEWSRPERVIGGWYRMRWELQQTHPAPPYWYGGRRRSINITFASYMVQQ